MTHAEKKFRQFQNFLSNASDMEREAALALVKVLDALPTKKKRIDILKKVAKKFNLK